MNYKEADPMTGTLLANPLTLRVAIELGHGDREEDIGSRSGAIVGKRFKDSESFTVCGPFCLESYDIELSLPDIREGPIRYHGKVRARPTPGDFRILPGSFCHQVPAGNRDKCGVVRLEHFFDAVVIVGLLDTVAGSYYVDVVTTRTAAQNALLKAVVEGTKDVLFITKSGIALQPGSRKLTLLLLQHLHNGLEDNLLLNYKHNAPNYSTATTGKNNLSYELSRISTLTGVPAEYNIVLGLAMLSRLLGEIPPLRRA
jgi:hypothetical protein